MREVFIPAGRVFFTLNFVLLCALNTEANEAGAKRASANPTSTTHKAQRNPASGSHLICRGTEIVAKGKKIGGIVCRPDTENLWFVDSGGRCETSATGDPDRQWINGPCCCIDEN